MTASGSGPARNNLPAELTSFVGRREELGAIRRLLGTTRLLSLTGPGGVGKTRLAIRTARDVARHYPDGVCLVELAQIQDPSLVTPAVFTALGLQDRSTGWSVPVLADYLSEKRLLLVLDNCEHLLDATAVLAGTLLRACPELAILATSRQALGVTGEVVEQVRPLSVPDGSDLSVASLTLSDGVMLFVERAAALQSDFAVDAGNAYAVLDLCQRLDGVPLALELAAVRLNALGLNALASGMNDQLRVLGTGDRSRLPRQQTLEGTIDWSYQLLSDPERLLWTRLSVFAGGFELDAAQQVCGGPDLSLQQIPTLLAALVERSLVGRELQDGRERFRVLEILRQFGRERLRETETERGVLLRHLDWITALAADVGANDHRQVELFARIRAERANLWAALAFCLKEPDLAASGVAICRDLWAHWLTEGNFSEVIGILSAFLERIPTVSRARAEALWVSSILAASMSDAASSRRSGAEALAIGRALGDAELVAWALNAMSCASWVEGRPEEALEHATEAVNLAHAMGLKFATLAAMDVKAGAQTFSGKVEAALETGLAAIALSEELGETCIRGYLLHVLGIAALRGGDADEAERFARTGVTLRRELGDVIGIAHLAEVLAFVAAAKGFDERAATLLGGADGIWRSAAGKEYGPLLPDQAQAKTEVLGRLGEARFQTAYEAGLAMTREEVADYALGLSVAAPRRRASDSPDASALSRREQEVAALVADGLTNAQTAARLFISERTVESHVTNIFNKLGVDSRVQIARWIASREAALVEA